MGDVLDQLRSWAEDHTLLTMRTPGHEEMGYLTEGGKWLPLVEHPAEPLHEALALHDVACQVWETYDPEDCDCSLDLEGLEDA